MNLLNKKMQFCIVLFTASKYASTTQGTIGLYIKLVVVNISGFNTLYKIEVNKSEKIQDLKPKLININTRAKVRIGVAMGSNPKFVYNYKILENNKHIQDYNIIDNSLIHVYSKNLTPRIAPLNSIILVEPSGKQLEIKTNDQKVEVKDLKKWIKDNKSIPIKRQILLGKKYTQDDTIGVLPEYFEYKESNECINELLEDVVLEQNQKVAHIRLMLLPLHCFKTERIRITLHTTQKDLKNNIKQTFSWKKKIDDLKEKKLKAKIKTLEQSYQKTKKGLYITGFLLFLTTFLYLFKMLQMKKNRKNNAKKQRL